MNIPVTPEEIEAIVREGLYPPSTSDIVLIAPSLEKVQDAISRGPKATVTLTCVGQASTVDVVASSHEAVVQTKLVFKPLTLSHISDLVIRDKGSYEFRGGVYEYREPDERYPDFISYSYTAYKVNVNTLSTSRYVRTGGGSGSEHLTPLE